MAGNRRRTVTFAGVMAAGQESDAALARVMRLRLGNLARDERVRPGGDGRLEISLGATRAPGDVADLARCALDPRGVPAQIRFQVRSQLLRARKAAAAASPAEKTEGLLAKPRGRLQAQLEPQL